MGNQKDNWLAMVGTLAVENASVRINYTDKPLEEGGRYARVRVLALGAEGVSVMEEPGVRELGSRLRPGDELDILAVRHQTRLVGRCRVNGYVKHMLNETTRVDAVEVSPPTKVYSGQLRDFYRAPVSAGVPVAPVQIRIHPKDEPAFQRAQLAGLDPEKIHKTRLVNISGGGMGLAMVIEKVYFKVFEVGTSVIIRAELPTLDKPLELNALIVHKEKLEIGDLYLGTSFHFEDAIEQKAVEDQLQRLSVWLQRQMLRKDNRD